MTNAKPKEEIKKALETLEDLQRLLTYYRHISSELTEANGIAIQALEKQIPKKPKIYIAFDGIERRGCPSCIRNEILYIGQNFCSVCGQRLDWSYEYDKNGITIACAVKR